MPAETGDPGYGRLPFERRLLHLSQLRALCLAEMRPWAALADSKGAYCNSFGMGLQVSAKGRTVLLLSICYNFPSTGEVSYRWNNLKKLRAVSRRKP